MRHPRSFKPERIANALQEIQTVDTHEAVKTRVNTGFAAGGHQINRTLLFTDEF